MNSDALLAGLYMKLVWDEELCIFRCGEKLKCTIHANHKMPPKTKRSHNEEMNYIN